MTNNSSGLGHYRSVGAYGAAASDNRMELVLQLMDGAIDQINLARGHIARSETAQKAEAIRRATAIVDGLRASLDVDRGGEIAGNLNALYDYMTRRLVEANLNDAADILDEVAGLLDEIRSAWQQITATAAEPA